ncbi:MAG: PQQ-dependent sugar dehydrogenase [Phycisphaerae bacterium]
MHTDNMFPGVLVCAAYALAGAQAIGQPLPGPCTINFETVCPNVTTVCGADFTGGGGCIFAMLPNCYFSGIKSYKVTSATPLTIDLNGDLLKLRVFFAGQDAGTGLMRFFNAAGAQVNTLSTNGSCPTTMPPLQDITLSEPVRSIEVTATGTVWIDDFTVNPGVCGNGTLEPGEACDDGNLINGDCCDANCMTEPGPCGACCTGFPAATCEQANAANCTGTLFDGEDCATFQCPACAADADCDDGVACTTDVCAAGRCVFTAGVTCGLGEACDVSTGACAPAIEALLMPVATGLCAPVDLTHAGDGSGRLFVVDQCGLVRIIDANGVLLPTPFLDITTLIPPLDGFFDERGLLGLAFHPDYVNNGRFFVRYSAPRADPVPPEPCNDVPPFFLPGCHKEVLSEFSVSAGDPNVADPSSEIVLFEVDEPQFNHNSGKVAFGPDGLLYFTLGDGGGANDSLDDPNLPHGPNGNGQNTFTALGSILRIDVDSPPDPGLPFAIPPDNPFADGVDGLPEIYAYGFRNAFRFSFDDGPGGDGSLVLADVGQDLFEEIDIVALGGNYGWAIREGFHCFDPFNPGVPPALCTDTGPLGETMVDPVMTYDHGVGIAVIGGFVYRGMQFPELTGRYVFGDFSTDFVTPDGRLFYADTTGPGAFVRAEFSLSPGNAPFGRFVKGIGEDEDGELYVLASDALEPAGTTGVVLKIVPPSPQAIPTVSEWGVVTMAMLVLAMGGWIFMRRSTQSAPA